MSKMNYWSYNEMKYFLALCLKIGKVSLFLTSSEIVKAMNSRWASGALSTPTLCPEALVFLQSPKARAEKSPPQNAGETH